MVEDCEFSMQQICRGRVIVPVSDAVYYDEQPDSFAVSLRQRFRWTVGCVQCVKYCLPDALRALRGGRGTDGPSRFAALDVIAYLLLIPAVGFGLIATVFGVLALQPLQPVLQSPALQPAFANVVPALFGAMAYQYYRKNIVVAIAPLAVMSVLFTLVPGLISSTSFMIIPSGALAIGIAYTIYKKKKASKEAQV